MSWTAYKSRDKMGFMCSFGNIEALSDALQEIPTLNYTLSIKSSWSIEWQIKTAYHFSRCIKCWKCSTYFQSFALRKRKWTAYNHVVKPIVIGWYRKQHNGPLRDFEKNWSKNHSLRLNEIQSRRNENGYQVERVCSFSFQVVATKTNQTRGYCSRKFKVDRS